MQKKKAIEEGLKQALKSQDKVKISVYRILLTQIKNKEIEKGKELTEGEIYQIVKSLIKQHEESIESFKKGERQDLVKKEEKELEILKELLPPPLTHDEIERIVEDTIRNVGAKDKKDLGKVMKLIMENYPGRIDGKTLNEMVLKRLSQ
ncbi:MAG: GatB/YqeY domain-containing protein [Desulfobacterota bacterium]|nr:GatB/YqeY domain-containing protein [Thermodesulfobacteriota bacterium]MDW8001416.1 GatB/YqeY domain-containing protein [Deltaproteobacteria bacterium]